MIKLSLSDDTIEAAPEPVLAYRDVGAFEGRPILFLHAANQTGASWGDVATHLPDYRCLCVDLPGSGNSADHPFTTFEVAADMVAETLRTLSPGRPVAVVGVSLGSYVGLSLALRHPDLVQTAVLSGFQVGPIRGGWWLVPLGDVVAPLMVSTWAQRQTARAIGISERSSAWPAAESACSAATLRRIHRAAIRFDVRDALPSLRCPLLALAGVREPAAILDSLEEVVANVPGSRAWLAPGGHVWPAQHPALFARLIRCWIEEGTVAAELGSDVTAADARPATE